MQLSNLATSSGGSLIRKMFNEALKLDDVVSFTVGEPDFITPQPAIDAVCKAWQDGLTHYTPNSGIPVLRQALAEYHAKDLKPDPAKNIIITVGAVEALQLTLLTLVNPGEEVIVFSPVWSNYFGQIRVAGAVCKAVPTFEENGFMPDPDDLEKAITPKTKMIMINSPSNPTGAVIDRGVYDRIAEILRKHKDIYVISDEVYSRIIFDGEHVSLTDYEDLRDRIIYINSFSKMLAMTGWRVGYAIAEESIIAAMTKLTENLVSCVSEPNQIGAAVGLRECQADIERMRGIYKTRRDILHKGINDIPGMSAILPKGAFYLFANIKELGMGSEEFCMGLLKKTGVVIVPGIGFGEAGEGFVRFSYATSEENIHEGIKRIDGYVRSL